MTTITKRGLYVTVAAGALLGAYAFGRFTAPTKIKTVESVVTRTVEDTQSKEQIRVLSEQLETMRRNVHRERITVARPDGTKETKVTTDIHTDTSKDTKEASSAVSAASAKVDVTQSTVKEKLVERARPQWFAGVLASSNKTLGVHIDHRFIGPVFFGAYGLSNGQFGLSLSLEF